jgi:hypothetical protein
MPETDTLVTHLTETITPQTAQRYLDENKLNRPIREWRVKLLTDDMKAGRYLENGEGGVTFDWNGNIAAGQHTLTACIRSGTTIRCRVTRGVAPESRATMNDSMHQRFSDDLAIAGVGNSSAAESLLRKAVVWEHVAKENKGQGGLLTWRTAKMSRSALAGEWPTYATGISTTLNDTKIWAERWKGIGNRGALQMFWWIITEKHGYPTEDAEEFFSHVIYGSQGEDKVMFRKLAMKLAENADAARQVFWLTRAWNNWVLQENVSKLQEPKGGMTDPFPRLRRPRG